jgi:FtsH-binding integral membrane protein
MAVPQVLLANWVVKTQAASVQTALAGHAVYSVAAYVWIGAYGLVLLIGLWALVGKPKSILPGALSLATAVVAMLAMTIYRDGLRDLTLLGKGYDVWQRTVVTNWSVVVIFLVVLVIGLVAIGWLISVMMRAKPVSEKVV